MILKIHAFEPNPELNSLFAKTIQRNATSKIFPHPVALGSKARQLELRILGSNTGSASLILDYDLTHCRVVPVQTMDAIATREKIATIRLIKIDVEGFEVEVLLGGDHVLETIRP